MPLSKSALAGVFRRSGSPGAHTMLFDDADPFVKKLAQSALHENRFDEIPVIVTFFSPDDWSVITTNGLLVCNRGEARFIAVHDIRSVAPVRYDGARPLRKKELESLRVSTRDGRGVDVQTDTGRTFSGMWNVLKTFEAQSRRTAAT